MVKSDVLFLKNYKRGFSVKVGIDGRSLKRQVGLGKFTYHLIHALAKIDSRNEYIIYLDLPQAAEKLPQVKNFHWKVLTPSNYFIWEQICLPLQAAKDGLDLLHSPANTAPLCLSKKIKLIITVHDVMFLLPFSVLPKSPSVYQNIGRFYRKIIVTAAARKAGIVATDSHYSAKDIIRYLKINKNKIKVVYLGSDQMAEQLQSRPSDNETLEKYKIHKPYLLALGGTDPRKNTEKVIQSFQKLNREERQKYQLVIVGIDRHRNSNFSELVKDFQLEDRIVFTGFVGESELATLYRQAYLFIYSSLYEGFGLPVLEAMSTGKPVVASKTTSIPEVGGRAVLYVNPESADEIACGIQKILNDSPDAYQNRVDLGLQQAAQFSWEKTALAYRSLYEAIGARI